MGVATDYTAGASPLSRGASPQITALLAALSTRHYIIPNLRNVSSKWENADEEDEANDISRAQKHVGKSFKMCFDRK